MWIAITLRGCPFSLDFDFPDENICILNSDINALPRFQWKVIKTIYGPV